MLTDTTGKIRTVFFVNDYAGACTAVITGITAKGELFCRAKEFE